MITNKKLANYYLNSLRQESLINNITSHNTDFFDVSYSNIISGRLPETTDKDIGSRSTLGTSPIEVVIAPIVLSGKRTLVFPFYIPATLTETGELNLPKNGTPWVPREFLQPELEDSNCSQEITPIAKVTEYLEKAKSISFTFDDWTDYIQKSNKFFRLLTHQSIQEFDPALIKKDSKNTNLKRHQDTCRIFLNVKNANYSMSIQNLYQAIADTNENMPLFTAINPGIDSKKQLTLSKKEIKSHYHQHYGQMSAVHGLTETQRLALANFDALNSGDLLAVSGPPGTGKTTLLQSVIATEWVKSAIQETYPPICVASSTNNQAVTNIIKNFSRITSTDTIRQLTLPNKAYIRHDNLQSLLVSHWIPNHKTYGLYLVSSRGFKESEFSAKITTNNDDYFKQLMTSTELSQSKEAFIKNCQLFFHGPKRTLSEYKSIIHSAIVDLVKDMDLLLNNNCADFNKQINELIAEKTKLKNALGEQEIRNNIAKRNLADWYDYEANHSSFLDYIPYIGKKIKQMKWQHFSILKNLPITINLESKLYEERQKSLSLHNQFESLENQEQEVHKNVKLYREALEMHHISLDNLLYPQIDTNIRYLIFLFTTHYWEARWLIEQDRERKNTTIDNQIQKWQIYSMLTPCIVGTFYQITSFFKSGTKPLFNVIDLLIVDEAGQASPDIALSSFSLAKKALIVGDDKQIPPIWNISENIDQVNLDKISGFTESESDLLKKHSFMASTGNLMSIANFQTKFVDRESHENIMLKEHFRCLPEIMEYFNALAYNNKLIPMRKSPIATSNWTLPQFGYAHVLGHTAKNDGSPYNQSEANAIAHWISANKEKLLSLDNNATSLESIIAIITPFREQEKKIRRALIRYNLGNENITCGTVHKMQGAERRVIIFSPVYDSADREFFFDKDDNMLNVAVSRAKDSFLYFGNIGILTTSGELSSDDKLPSEKLARCLFRHKQNRISDVSPFEQYKPIIHLTDAKAHDAWLIHELQQAKKRVQISSPYISEHTLRNDAAPLLREISKAIQRGVEVIVYPSEYMYDNQAKQKVGFKAGIELLKQKGVKIKLTTLRIHSKQILIDGHILADGSFNWLSAKRDPKSKYYTHDTTIVVDDYSLAAEFSLNIFNSVNTPALSSLHNF